MLSLMKSIKAVVNRVVNPIAKKRGLIHGKIILEWEKIVGTQYASYCAPLKVSFRQGYRTYGTLHMKVNPSHVLLVTHSQDLVIEKINTFFGYKAVNALKIIQMPFTPTPSTLAINIANISEKKESIQDLPPEKRLSRALENLESLITLEEQKKKKP